MCSTPTRDRDTVMRPRQRLNRSFQICPCQCRSYECTGTASSLQSESNRQRMEASTSAYVLMTLLAIYNFSARDRMKHGYPNFLPGIHVIVGVLKQLTSFCIRQSFRQCTIESIHKVRCRLWHHLSSGADDKILLFSTQTDRFPTNAVFLVCAFMVRHFLHT